MRSRPQDQHEAAKGARVRSVGAVGRAGAEQPDAAKYGGVAGWSKDAALSGVPVLTLARKLDVKPLLLDPIQREQQPVHDRLGPGRVAGNVHVDRQHAVHAAGMSVAALPDT